MITLDKETVDRLMNMPIDHTVGIQIEDRHFTIVDTEEFLRILNIAKMTVECDASG